MLSKVARESRGARPLAMGSLSPAEEFRLRPLARGFDGVTAPRCRLPVSTWFEPASPHT